MSQEDNTNFSTKLAAYVAALRPIIYINHFDSHSVDSLIASIAEKGTKIYEYNEAGHHIDFLHKISVGTLPGYDNLNGFLSAFDDNEPKNVFLVLKDVHRQLRPESADAAIIARLKSIAERTMFREGVYVTVFLVCSELVIPSELEK
ncbi:hypothetical protein ACSZOB_19950 [Aeromonas veronii]